MATNPFSGQEADHWTCPKCGTVNDSAFCHGCGQRRAVPTDIILCACGHRNTGDSNFCGNCGRSLQAPPPPSPPAKKKKSPVLLIILIVILLLAVVLLLTMGRGSEPEPHTHQWEPAVCGIPSTCSGCGETTGEPGAHQWGESTCKTPAVCSLCGETSSEPGQHQWVEATCTVAKYCQLCKATSGTPMGHKWQEATLQAPKTCSVCSQTTGEKLKGGYLGTPAGEMEETVLRNGSFTLNTHALVLKEAITNCKELSVDMSVEMHNGTKCTDWQLWGRKNGSFQKIGTVYLPNGDGDICQTISYDTPVSFDAVVLTPTIPGGYSWSLWFEIKDVWVEP